jgi:GDPmannose 4,6-dehydratase
MPRRALITGITGQDGSYLAELLLEKGYEVHGTVRRSSSFNTSRIDHIFNTLHLHHADMLDATSIRRVVELSQPDEVYHLAAQSHVRVSFDEPEYTFEVNATGALRLLEAVRVSAPDARFYQAGSSEMFGNAPAPQTIDTPFHPRSPYGVSKVAAHWHAVNYREAYGMFVANGILFNHESPRRGPTFVTQKICQAVKRRDSVIELGELGARRDWGFAGDYVRAMWMMLQREEPGDFVVATGRSRAVAEWYKAACELGGHYPEIQYSDRLTRPSEVPHLKGIANLPGWAPTMTFDQLVRSMVLA